VKAAARIRFLITHYKYWSPGPGRMLRRGFHSTGDR
jgi:hypothetical protein